MIKLLSIGTAAALLGLASPAAADNGKTPPGNPCAKGNGNPCNGNNGNSGQQGNAGGPKGYSPAPPMSIPRPNVVDRHVYITQIGSGNRATVRQTAPNAYAAVHQDGSGNQAGVTQSGIAIAYADIRQLETANSVEVTQGGVTAGNMLRVTQSGNANTINSSQTATAGENGAILYQQGAGNQMALNQSGGDNLADLSQTGDNNMMTASQSGSGNRLVWAQQGDGLSNLAISQSGGQSVMITQKK